MNCRLLDTVWQELQHNKLVLLSIRCLMLTSDRADPLAWCDFVLYMENPAVTVNILSLHGVL